MRLDRIHAEGSHQTVHLLQLIVLESKPSNLRGTNRGKVGGMTEEDGPLALLPFVEGVKATVRGVHGEVGDDVAQAKASVGGAFRVEAHVGLGSCFDVGAHYLRGWKGNEELIKDKL